MGTLVEGIVVDLGGLIQQDVFTTDLDWPHHGSLVGTQIIQIELLVLDEENIAAYTHRCMSLLL